MSKVWVLNCLCGWSKMVPRSMSMTAQAGEIEKHRAQAHSGGRPT